MADKEQIVIDGVDVKKCDFFLPSNKYCGLYSTGCRFVLNCHFKQLARKTQECEELKKQLMQKDEVDMFFNTPLEGWSSNPCDICESKNKFDRYRKALEEIEGYCNNVLNFTAVRTTESDILDIINKAKDGSNAR